MDVGGCPTTPTIDCPLTVYQGTQHMCTGVKINKDYNTITDMIVSNANHPNLIGYWKRISIDQNKILIGHNKILIGRNALWDIPPRVNIGFSVRHLGIHVFTWQGQKVLDF
ncbi:hypothetical protein DPMN_095555 [Dreissena polymorpha]|uniref:Uncharacterized protein n=1 Tax=Dreissena polymorpha TaxID=45954 RepID=A0A9D4L9K7_DREPO|nr:hypothetical protein DPMN_095555 [Dreissena polymorpha]